ncbi:hypothetical protein J6TS1_27990 [Siminovitchia terrae]|uniref:Uncharacterized protein n=1 Tax=Siminovitchia terrae TaxID=1914933 RepID=A0ABQ4KZ28_SIMTE|nr:DUF3173 family protein [Siminovitchia terrae]GIN96929.1 hypothetical protein J6TS1_27990 [Siminovitchia terrae]
MEHELKTEYELNQNMNLDRTTLEQIRRSLWKSIGGSCENAKKQYKGANEGENNLPLLVFEANITTPEWELLNMKSKFNFIKKDALMQVGFNANTASEIIRCIKTQLAREGWGLYYNPRISFVPADRAIEFLLGVSGDKEAYQNVVEFLKSELVHRDDLVAWGIPKETANQLIKEAQQKMADKGYIFYQNTRRWFAPMNIINQLLGGC